ncbi:MAG: hypothetical protein LJF15_07075 [Acidobacteria bacterium]|nr:hypothetical protein [Acidobacteriota bacterium]
MKIAVVLALMLLVAGVVLWRTRSATREPNAAADVNVVMREAAADAIETAKAEHDVTLDYSSQSVEQVEAILARIYDEQAGAPIPLDREKDEAWRWGAYVGEVIRRTSPGGGHWEIDHEAAGPRSFPVRLAERDSFPITWCRKRLRNGPEDNVWHKFQILYGPESREIAPPAEGDVQ